MEAKRGISVSGVEFVDAAGELEFFGVFLELAVSDFVILESGLAGFFGAGSVLWSVSFAGETDV